MNIDENREFFRSEIIDCEHKYKILLQEKNRLEKELSDQVNNNRNDLFVGHRINEYNLYVRKWGYTSLAIGLILFICEKYDLFYIFDYGTTMWNLTRLLIAVLLLGIAITIPALLSKQNKKKSAAFGKVYKDNQKQEQDMLSAFKEHLENKKKESKNGLF